MTGSLPGANPDLSRCGICGRAAPAAPKGQEFICDPCWADGVADGIFSGPNPCGVTTLV